MEQPILFKDIDVNERKFRLRKMDARTGSYMLCRLVKILSPIFKNINIDKVDGKEGEADNIMDDIDFSELVSSICDLPEEQFRYIQDNCLQVVDEILPAGPTKVLDKYGNYGVLNIEYDTWLLMNLTIQSLIFNVSGFFEGSPLTSMFKGLNISQLNLKM